MKTNVVVVIPNWNGADYIGKCLESLEKQSLKPHTIVVDNGSNDGSVQIIQSSFPIVELLGFPDNAGFSGGVNRGIRPAIKTGYDYIALLNNDAIADEHWLEHLVAAAEKHPKAGIITGKLLRMDKKHLDSTGDFYSIWGLPFPRGRNQVDKGQFNLTESVFAATGGASLYRAKLFKDIGLFDEDFFAYLEDVDISFRARLAGWEVIYEPKAVAYHHVGATSSKLGSFSRYHFVKNFVYTYNKNMPGWLFWKYKPLFMVQLARFGAGALRDGQIGFYLQAIAVAVWHMPSTLRKRQHIQRQRKVSPTQIDSLLYKERPPKIPNF